ncbi:MAG: integral membrane protein [Maribacter sp.]|jgi:integral membrane protein
MLKLFRVTAILEGISYLALFGITMPLKYWAEIPGPNIIVGYAHGALFITFIALALLVCINRKWGIKRFIIFGIASLLPFATFYVEQKYLKPVEA